MRAAVGKPAKAGGVLAEAVIVVKDQPGVTVDWLGRVLGVSQPGAVHVVNRLVAIGWVDKRRGSDARSRALVLTAAGRAAARRILRARHQVLTDLVHNLSAGQRDQLADIAATLLRPLARDDRDLAELCRLCDRGCCESCPVHEGYLSRRAEAPRRSRAGR